MNGECRAASTEASAIEPRRSFECGLSTRPSTTCESGVVAINSPAALATASITSTGRGLPRRASWNSTNPVPPSRPSHSPLLSE